MIELLVVIVIIGILTTISLFALAGSRETSRDARRKADLESIRIALELYKSDNGVYPGETYCDSSIGSCNPCPCSASDWNGTIVGALEPTYILDLPLDPINDSTHYYYYEPVCSQNESPCGASRTCPSGICCAYEVGALLEDGTIYEVCSP